jgi:hypothetical protein
MTAPALSRPFSIKEGSGYKAARNPNRQDDLPDMRSFRTNVIQVFCSHGAAIADLEPTFFQKRANRMHVDMSVPMEPGQPRFP